MSTREMQLISRIIRAGDLTPVLEWGITHDDFLTDEGRAFFNHIVGYYSRPDTSGSVLGINNIQNSYPMFVLCDDENMTTEALCVEVRKNRLAVELRQQAQTILEMLEKDPLQAAAYGQNACAQTISLGLGRDCDVMFTSAIDTIVHKYEQKKAGVDFSVCKWPWHPLNEETGGIQPDDYIVLYGRPKSMKSWVLASIIAHAYTTGKKAVIYTKEMTPENIFMRIAACLAVIEYHGLRMGTLTEQEEYNLYAMQRMIHVMKSSQDKNLICLDASDAPPGGDSVPWLQSKIEKHKPDICFVDGMYLMADISKGKKSREERITNISRSMRQMVLNFARKDTPCPCIVTLQANRQAAAHGEGNLDEIAYSDAIGQDITIAMRVINDRQAPTISMVMAGSREFQLDGFRIYGMPAVNFGYHSMLTAKEIEKAKEGDTGEVDDAKAHTKKRTSKSNNHAAEAKAIIKAAKRLNELK